VLGPHVPWHVSRFLGDYRMTSSPPTPLATLELACRCGTDAGLHYVYCGNVSGEADESTYCPACGAKVIDRAGYAIKACRITDGRCASCGRVIEGVWSAQ